MGSPETLWNVLYSSSNCPASQKHILILYANHFHSLEGPHLIDLGCKIPSFQDYLLSYNTGDEKSNKTLCCNCNRKCNDLFPVKGVIDSEKFVVIHDPGNTLCRPTERKRA